MDDRILVVGPSWVGDMVMAQPLLKSLNRSGGIVDVLAPASTLPLCERMPEVRDAIRMETGHGDLLLAYRYRLGRELGRRNYTHAIVLPNSAKSALVPFFAGISRRTGFLGEMRYFLLNDIRMADRKKTTPMVDRFLALGDRSPAGLDRYPRLQVDRTNQADCLDRLGLDGRNRPVAALCPGAEFGEAKRWPPEYYAALGRFCISAGMQVWIFGSDGDGPTAARIREQIGDDANCSNLAGRTTLQDAVDLLDRVSLAVSNDSGLMHIAAATGCMTVGIYGSTSPEFTPPLTDTAMIFGEDLPCRPCFRRVCPYGHTDCLRKLKPEKLFPAIERFLETLP